ncbi:MAG: LysM peptidoglycan-binding domain-containing protein [Gaiellaceae bacterium]
MKAHGWQRYAAPAAFLLAVTIAVVLVRAGFEAGHGGNPATGTVLPPTQTVRTTPATTTTKKKTRPKPAQQFTTVQAGDTFAVIAKRTGIPVAVIEQLNPKVSSTTLHIGQRIRIK